MAEFLDISQGLSSYGTRREKIALTKISGYRASTNVPTPPTSSLTSSQPSNSTKGLDVTHSFLPNTSIAATSCLHDVRWLFQQDLSGAIRGAQYSGSAWTFTSDQYNFTTAKIGSPLGASCVNITGSENAIAPLKTGLLVSSVSNGHL